MADEMVIDAVQSPNRPTAGAPKQLNMKALERIRETGRHAVGDGLYLQVATSGARSWLYRYQRHGRRHDLGLGPLPPLSRSPWHGRPSPKSANSFTVTKTR